MKLSQLALTSVLSFVCVFSSVLDGAYALEKQANINKSGTPVTTTTPAASTPAVPTASTAKPAASTSGAGGMSSAGPTTVTVTEAIPGANCTLSGGGSIETRRYKCTIGKGFSSVMEMLSGMIKYGTFLIVLLGILMIVASGVQISLGGIDSGMQADAKKRITQVLAGLAFLFMVSMILNTVAPWVYR